MEEELIEDLNQETKKAEEPREEQEVVNVLKQVNWYLTDTIWISLIAMLFFLPSVYTEVILTVSHTSILLHIHIVVEVVFEIIMHAGCNPLSMVNTRLSMISAVRCASMLALLTDMLYRPIEASTIYMTNILIIFTMMYSVCWFQTTVFIVRVQNKPPINLKLFMRVFLSGFVVCSLVYLPRFLLHSDVYVNTIRYGVYISLFIPVALVEYILLTISVITYKRTKFFKNK